VRRICGGVLVFLLAGFQQKLYGDTVTFNIVPITVPGSTSTTAIGINDAGQIVGSYVSAGQMHGFVDTGGVFTNLDVPGSSSTQATGINNVGQIVGFYTDASGASHVFLDTSGTFQTVNIPAASFINIPGVPGQVAINDAGQMVGTTSDARAFLYSNGQLTFLTPPPVSVINGGEIAAFGINDAGAIVGSVIAMIGFSGFVYRGGNYITDGGDENATYGINNAGDYVTNTSDGGPSGLGGTFVVANGIPTFLPPWPPGPPGSLGNIFFTGFARGMNDSDQIVGIYPGDNGNQSFLATPVPEPRSAGIFICGLVGLVLAIRRTRSLITHQAPT